MKKLFAFVLCFIIVSSLCITDISPTSYIDVDFQIYNSLVNVGGGYKTTYLNVIVYRNNYSVDDIVDYHAKMNGTSNKLIIRIYPNKYSLIHGEAVEELTFYDK